MEIAINFGNIKTQAETRAEWPFSLPPHQLFAGALSTRACGCDSCPWIVRLPPVAAPCRRGPSLARRVIQAGNVFQKRRSKSDGWDSEAPAYGRYWKDVPGLGRRREHIPLGICHTRVIAQRKCALH